jgi:two-component system response regulator HydG
MTQSEPGAPEDGAPGARPAPEATILVVDDEPELCRALSKLLSRNGYEVLTAGNGEEALQALRRQEVHLVLSDLQMPRMGGLDLLKAAQIISPATEFVIITGHGTIETAVDAMKSGAYDFIEKPFSTSTTLKVVRKALEKQNLLTENLQLRRRLEEMQGTSDIIGRSEPMRRVVATAQQAAPSSATILISGESGTGKEVFATAIHRWSERARRSMVTVSCAALPETLLEAELFGYEKGAFTGAVARRKGRFELADRSTLFLDEVGEMSPATQVKLLRVLQEGTLERLGGGEPVSVDVRIIAATNADLPALVEAGRFREDLFYRLNVINVELPPLRRRGDDVILLADFFLARYNAKNSKHLAGFTPEAQEVLGRYAWPGNVRELENAVERAVVLCRQPQIDVDALPPHVVAGRARKEQIVIPVGTTLRDAEMELIQATLESAGGDKETAARILGIAARTIYRRLQ